MGAGERNRRVVVVGGGAAGIVAAHRAAVLGASVVLLEKNGRLGMKILISGGGKCNVTHAGDMEALRRAFRPAEARFLKPSFYRFTNREIVRMLEERGLRLYARPDGRLFPVDGTAKDVVAILGRCLEEAGVEVRLNCPVRGLLVQPTACAEASGDPARPASEVTGVEIEGGRLDARRVVLCVGGSSYPGTGATGDGWRWLEQAGHTITRLRAALAPLFLQDPHAEWAGVALRDVSLRARQAGKSFTSWRGDLLFTHRGLSGPCALGISRDVAERRSAGLVTVEVDLRPDTPPDRVARELLDWVQANPRRPIRAFVEPLLPERLREPFLASTGGDPETRAAHLPQKIRARLAAAIKGWPIGEVQHIPLEKGEVVAGGVSLDEVDPQTMRSRKISGLYLCGEILDLAGPVGGYNLQPAWSTGFVAGDTAARDAGEISPRRHRGTEERECI